MSVSRLPQALYLIISIAAGMTGPAYAQISDDTIKVGVITDMNGPLSSATGRGSVEAARMAAEEFGFSIDGRRIEIISADHQNKPDIGASIVRQWFDVEHVNAAADIAKFRGRICHRGDCAPAQQSRFDWRRILGLYRQSLCADEHTVDVGHLRRSDRHGESGFWR